MRRAVILLSAFVLVVVGAGVAYRTVDPAALFKAGGPSGADSRGAPTFPVIGESGLSPTQRKIVTLTRQQFEAEPPGTTYSQGVHEAWCSDFVSWILLHAGVPLKNPNSGSWRIPGTYTLMAYYQSLGRFRSASSGYHPRLGDVAIYEDSPVFGDHTNFVLSDVNGVLTTVGGNENNRIRVYSNTAKNYRGLIGYGVLA